MRDSRIPAPTASAAHRLLSLAEVLTQYGAPRFDLILLSSSAARWLAPKRTERRVALLRLRSRATISGPGSEFALDPDPNPKSSEPALLGVGSVCGHLFRL